MGKKVDLTGQVFGFLTVIKPAENIKGQTAWLCRCACGNEITVKSKYLKEGRRKSCGCKKHGVETLHYVDGTCIEMIKSTTVRTNNRSGVPGVFFDRSCGKWRAEIMFQGKRKYLGRFDKFADAVKARQSAKEKLHDDFIARYSETEPDT